MLRFNDPTLDALADRLGGIPTLRYYDDAWTTLFACVVYQQVSGKAAASIMARIMAHFNGVPTPAVLLDSPVGTLQGFGVTERKENTLRDLAASIKRGALNVDVLREKDDRLVHYILTHYKGVGEWTVHMFLVFHAGRPDIFMPRDLGLRKAIQRLDGLDEEPNELEAAKRAEAWKPNRTAACALLWRSLGDDFPEPGFGNLVPQKVPA